MTLKTSLFAVLVLLFAAGPAGLTACGQVGGENEAGGTESKGLSLKYPGGMTTIPFGNVVGVEITVFPPMMNPNNNNESRRLSGRAAMDFLESAGLTQARATGPAAAMKTGQLEISYKNSGSEIEKRTFNILNERLLEDATYPEITYHGSLIFDRFWLDGLPSN